MKHLIALVFCLICIQLYGCSKNVEPEIPNVIPNSDTMKLKITIGTRNFTATLYNNETANAFKAGLPLTISMADLNANEKHADLAKNLPANASNPVSIQSGDLMLYGSKTLVLFYKSFSTSYSYTRIARVDNVSELAAALGSESTTVKFELEL